MRSSRFSGLRASKARFSFSEKVLCYYELKIYEAQVLDIRLIGPAENPEQCEINYFIHYVGWNKSWDEWVSERRLLKFSEENVQLMKSTQLSRANKENGMKLSNGNKNSSDKNPSNKPATLWTWDTVLSHSNENAFPRAAPVSSFQFQKVPLSQDWREISTSIVGSVGEINMKNRLCARLAPLKKNSQKRKKGKIPYWFVEIVRCEGYIVKVRFLGYPPSQEINLPNCAQFRWIHISQLKAIGYYSLPPRKNNIAPPPAFIQSLDEDAILTALNDDLRGKITVNDKNFEVVEQARPRTGINDRWNSGSKVEVRNFDCCSEMRIAQVSKTSYQRVEVFYCDTDVEHMRKSIWVHEDSELIQPVGWTKTVGAKIHHEFELFQGRGYNPPPLEPSLLRVDQYPGIPIKVGMLFEFINPIKLDEIALGKVTEVLRYGYFHCQIESYMWSEDLVQYAGGENKFHYHISSDEIFPLGTFVGETPSPVPVSVPSDSGGANYAVDFDFDWETYLRVNGLEALDLPPKTEETTHNFEDSMWVEAVDSLEPALICPAQIVKIVNPYALKVRFLGWDKKFDQWKPITSLEIYPVGWCQLHGYPLVEPPPVSGSAVLECPVSRVTGTETHAESGAAEMPEPEQGPSSVLAVPSSKKRLGLRSSNSISPTTTTAVSLQKSRKSNPYLAKRVCFQNFDDE